MTLLLFVLLAVTASVGGTAPHSTHLPHVHKLREQIIAAKTGKVDTQESDSGGKKLVDSTCPDADAILPCVCYTDDDERMNLDCTEVESEEQLAQVMTSHFPSSDFYELKIYNNDKLKVLRTGTLGNTTYQLFNVSKGALQEVEVGALSGSYSTARGLAFYGDKLTTFCWDEISAFTKLEVLYLHNNNINTFPTLSSNTLVVITLAYNPLGSLPEAAFAAMPILEQVFLNRIGLEQLTPGTFSGAPFLWSIDLTSNLLTDVPEDAVALTSKGLHFVDLSSNNISSVAVNAFSGLGGGDLFSYLVLGDNDLTVLEEEVWRPQLEDGVSLVLKGNPLACGCDIAWLVLDEDLLSLVEVETTCADGRRLVDLDPTWYKDNC